VATKIRSRAPSRRASKLQASSAFGILGTVSGALEFLHSTEKANREDHAAGVAVLVEAFQKARELEQRRLERIPLRAAATQWSKREGQFRELLDALDASVPSTDDDHYQLLRASIGITRYCVERLREALDRHSLSPPMKRMGRPKEGQDLYAAQAVLLKPKPHGWSHVDRTHLAAIAVVAGHPVAKNERDAVRIVDHWEHIRSAALKNIEKGFRGSSAPALLARIRGRPKKSR